MQMGGKSGQHRAPCFLTGRYKIGDDFITASAAENIPLGFLSKGEKVV
jgi:hypothetical protein